MITAEMGWKMRNVRRLLGITRKQIAKECGVSKGTIRNIEKGRMMMSAEMLARVSMALGISADYLLGLTE